MGKIFGTDGVRGIANQELTGELVYKLGRIGGHILTAGTKKPRILIGSDTRISRHMIENALTAGLNSAGIDAVIAGVIPTPGIAYLVRKLKMDGGIMISASHNPMEYNGIKFFDSKGHKLSDETENEIEKYILNNIEIEDFPSGKNIGVKIHREDAVNYYKEYILNLSEVNLAGYKIALDCANGSASVLAPEIFSELGAQVYVINNNPDGTNINDRCGSTNMKQIKEIVAETRADIGFAFDGDADRVLAVDENGNEIDGDYILAVCGKKLSGENKLNKNTVVATVMSNMALDIYLKENDISIVKTNVGDRYVLEEMKENEYIIGGEQSGHIIFLKHNTTGDGIITAVEIMNSICSEKKSSSEIFSVFKKLPQVLVNARVDNNKKYKYMDDEIIKSKIMEMEKSFHGKGRVLIRPSGTEPLVRVMIEGECPDEIKKEAEQLSKIIEERLR